MVTGLCSGARAGGRAPAAQTRCWVSRLQGQRTASKPPRRLLGVPRRYARLLSPGPVPIGGGIDRLPSRGCLAVGMPAAATAVGAPTADCRALHSLPACPFLPWALGPVTEAHVPFRRPQWPPFETLTPLFSPVILRPSCSALRARARHQLKHQMCHDFSSWSRASFSTHAGCQCLRIDMLT